MSTPPRVRAAPPRSRDVPLRPAASPQVGALRAARLHVTLPRLMVLRTLAECPPLEPGAPVCTIGRLHRLMDSLGRTVPLPSLYRVLRDLHAAGLARQVALPGRGRAKGQGDVARDGVGKDARDGVALEGGSAAGAHCDVA